jgi:hypothetical protein
MAGKYLVLIASVQNEQANQQTRGGDTHYSFLDTSTAEYQSKYCN